jgi:pimeloyl-ACP methyl ester carboxylesterase
VTTWILLRGLSREAAHWGEFTQGLANLLASGDQVIALDLPGNGTLHAGVSPITVPGMVVAARRALAARGSRPPYAFVAMSLGGMVALQWTHEFAHEVAGCVLINTSLRAYSPFWQRLQPRNYARLCRLVLPGLSALERERGVLAMTSCYPQRHAGTAEQWAAVARQRPVSRGNVVRQLAAAAFFSLPPGPPRVSMLMLVSAHDELVSPKCSERIASRWCVPIRLHPDAGHDLPLDDPDWVMQQILGWWQATASWPRKPF